MRAGRAAPYGGEQEEDDADYHEANVAQLLSHVARSPAARVVAGEEEEAGQHPHDAGPRGGIPRVLGAKRPPGRRGRLHSEGVSRGVDGPGAGGHGRRGCPHRERGEVGNVAREEHCAQNHHNDVV